MPLKMLTEFLDGNNIKYMFITHSPAFTAQEIAQSACIPGREMAKAIIIKVDDRLVMAVLPATEKINFDYLREIYDTPNVSLATENEFRGIFPECEIGAMPPFGNLFAMEVLVTEDLTRNEEIAFNAGTHAELIRLKYKDYESLVKPRVLNLAKRWETVRTA